MISALPKGDSMKLSETSLEWALAHLQRENDTDLFPEPIEIEIVNQQKEEIVRLVKDVDLGAYSWHPSRRFMVPKGELSYRMITQLDPLDSVMLSACTLTMHSWSMPGK